MRTERPLFRALFHGRGLFDPKPRVATTASRRVSREKRRRGSPEPGPRDETRARPRSRARPRPRARARRHATASRDASRDRGAAPRSRDAHPSRRRILPGYFHLQLFVS